MTQVVKVRVASVISSDSKANDATWALGCAMGERPYLDINTTDCIMAIMSAASKTFTFSTSSIALRVR